MEGSSPAKVFMLSMDTLLFFSKHEPIKGHHDEVADDCDGIKEMMSRLHVDCAIGSLERVFAEVDIILRG